MRSQKKSYRTSSRSRQRADLAEFYRFSTAGLTAEELLELEAHRPRLQARRTREQIAASGQKIRPSVLYDLVLQETGDRDLAEKCHNDLAKQMLKQGLTPD